MPTGVAGKSGGHEGGPQVHAGATGGARGGVDRAVRVPARGAGPAAPGWGSRGCADRGGAVRGAVRVRPRIGRQRRLAVPWRLIVPWRGRSRSRVRPRALAPPPPRRRLARFGDGAPGRRAGAAGRGHERRPLRAPRRSRTAGRADGDPSRPVPRRPRGPAAAGRRVVPQGRIGAAGPPPGRRRHRRLGPRARLGLARGHREQRRHRGRLSRRAHLRALPLPGLPGPEGPDALLAPVRAVLGGRPAPVPPAHAGGRAAAGPRAGCHRADGSRGVLPHLLGPDAVREVARDSGPGSGQRRGLDRDVRAGDRPRGPDPPRAAVRAVYQRGTDGVPGRGHRLQLRAAGGGHPVRLRQVRARAHGDGLQPGHVPGAVRGPRGGVRAGVPAAAGGPGGEGARDVRLRDGPAGPRGRGRVRGVLRAAGGGRGRGTFARALVAAR